MLKKSLKKQGLKNKEISQELNIALKTLERHITYMKKNGLL
ncbi:MAG: LuxR C-terminal-related transcriptional regulator [Sarcina ventriculi]